MTRLEKSEPLQRMIRKDEPDALGISTLTKTLEAIENDRRDEAEELVDYLRQEWKLVHDTFVDFWGRFFDYIVEHYGVEELFKLVKSSQSASVRMAPIAYQMTGAKGFLLMSSGFHRAHLAGSERKGGFSVEDQGDRYAIVLDPCGSGGNMRRCGHSAGAIHPKAEVIGEYGVADEQTAWNWNKKGVLNYCVHCCAIEATNIETAGFSPVIFEAPLGPNEPCIQYIYKDPKTIPAEFYERLGKSKPQL